MKNLSSINVPYHIAIIMDGNGRWAEKRVQPRSLGHYQGVKTLQKIIQHCVFWRIKILTVFVFSSENWARPKEEVDLLMRLLVEQIDYQAPFLHKNGIQVKFLLNDRTKIATYNYHNNINAQNIEIEDAANSSHVLDKINYLEYSTQNNDVMLLNLAFNYGGRGDIIQAVNRIITDQSIKDRQLISEEEFADYLLTGGSHFPDLLIRTGGECRISNFLLWQIAYSEIYFCKKLWPSFSKKDLDKAIEWFSTRERKFGGLK